MSLFQECQEVLSEDFEIIDMPKENIINYYKTSLINNFYEKGDNDE